MNWLLIALGALPAFALSWLIHSVDVNHLKAKQEDALKAQAAQLTATCDKIQANAAKQEKDYEQTIASMRDELDSYSLFDASCAYVAPSTGSHSIPTASTPPKPTKGDGLRVNWLRRFAADYTDDAAKLRGLQGWLNGMKGCEVR